MIKQIVNLTCFGNRVAVNGQTYEYGKIYCSLLQPRPNVLEYVAAETSFCSSTLNLPSEICVSKI